MKIVFTMPVYNEEEGIVKFCDEIIETFKEFEVQIILVNDLSTDNSKEVISEKLMTNYESNIILINNSKNLGHGPSTLKGMRRALKVTDSNIIVTVDGDGQFYSDEIMSLVKQHVELKADITEGVRINRQDPTFRKVSTIVCKILVFAASRKLPQDANTCLRIYQPKSLEFMVKKIREDFMIPNVLISTITRNEGFAYKQIQINSIPRRGAESVGSTWKQKFSRIPSRRYLVFCMRATLQWFSIFYLGRKSATNQSE
jgi:glycosyltransferase involved in cell wall biosynthesis